MLRPDGPAASYVARVQELIDEAWQAQSAAIDEAAGIVVDALAGGGLLHVFGTGHSHMLGVTPPIMASSNLASSDDAGQLARLAQAGRRPVPVQEP